MNVEKGGNMLGRQLEMFRHPSDPAWGYAKPQTDTFALLYPKDYDETKTYPLLVVFHSAGHDVYSTVCTNGRPGNHDIYHAPEDVFALYPDCYTNTDGTTDWWWGGMSAQEDEITERSTTELQPVEKRCIATVEWVFDHYPIDRNRVYAVGNSMGGSGALGVCLRRGDIFTAIKANVPAGVRHAADRCLLDKPVPEGFQMPDPPIVIDYSAQNDDWSRGHEVLYRGMENRKYALMGFWGPFGHANDNAVMHEYNDLIHAFDIYSLRLDEAYPAFTHATTDDPIPWPDHRDSEEAGQVNAFFRWKVLRDETDCFEIELRLLRQDEWESRVTFPDSAAADVTLRRLQKFTADGQIRWQFGKNCGTVTPDGCITIPGLTITQTPTVLKLRK